MVWRKSLVLNNFWRKSLEIQTLSEQELSFSWEKCSDGFATI
jgi:hypothetical protein